MRKGELYHKYYISKSIIRNHHIWSKWYLPGYLKGGGSMGSNSLIGSFLILKEKKNYKAQ